MARRETRSTTKTKMSPPIAEPALIQERDLLKEPDLIEEPELIEEPPLIEEADDDGAEPELQGEGEDGDILDVSSSKSLI